MREALAEALSDFDGAIVVVSHDRHLIGLVCDRFVRVADGRVDAFDGDLDDYAVWLRSRNNRPMAAATAALPERPAVPAPKPVDDKATRRQRTRLQQLEARLAQIDASNADLAAQLADPAIYSAAHRPAPHPPHDRQPPPPAN